MKAVGAALLASGVGRRAAAQDMSVEVAPDALTPYRERYASLQTYADAGRVTVEQQPPGAAVVSEHASFTTFYRAPRKFFFDFVEDADAGGDRFVIWCDGGDFQSWWATTGVHEVHSQGRGAIAFLTGQYPTMGASLLIPPLLFARAELPGAVAGLRDARDAGEENIEGRRFAKVVADTVVIGEVVRTRPTTLWFDVETRLLHKVVEDTPPGESLDRRTTFITPQADPQIEEARFRFTPPA